MLPLDDLSQARGSAFDTRPTGYVPSILPQERMSPAGISSAARASAIPNSNAQLAPVHEVLARTAGTLENSMRQLDAVVGKWGFGQRDQVFNYLYRHGIKYGQPRHPVIPVALLQDVKQRLLA